MQVMSKLAAEHQSVNLGQGFPDDEGPDTMKQVRAALSADKPQYHGFFQLLSCNARLSHPWCKATSTADGTYAASPPTS
jgi:hypothetical protein